MVNVQATMGWQDVYCINRYIARRNKGNRTLKQNSLFNCKNKSIIEEHEYGRKMFYCEQKS
jgi:hypothetical protein